MKFVLKFELKLNDKNTNTNKLAYLNLKFVRILDCTNLNQTVVIWPKIEVNDNINFRNKRY